MEVNLNNILESLGLKAKFDEKAQKAYTSAKENAKDPSVFESKDKFVEYYSNEVFGSSTAENLPIDDFVKQAKDNGFIEEKDIAGFQTLVDRDGNSELSRKEASDLIGTAYDSATGKDKELYESVKVQPWGTGDDDCLSRIIQKHVDGVKLYSEDYNQYIKEMCTLNNIDDPDNVDNKEVKMPEIKRDKDGGIMRDDDGKMKFYCEDELKEMKGVKDNFVLDADGNKVYSQTSDDGSTTKDTVDANGNVLKREIFNSDAKDAEADVSINYKYDKDGKKTGFEQNNKGGLKVTGTCDDKGRTISEETTRLDGVVIHTKYEHKDDGTAKKIETMDDGWKSESELDKEGRETKGTVNFPSGENWEYSYKYNYDGTTDKTIKSSKGYTSEIKISKEGLPISQKDVFDNGTIDEMEFKGLVQWEHTETKPDGTITHSKTSADGITSYEKTNAQGETIESGKKDAFGEISKAKPDRGGTISIRTYEDGTVIEWQNKGQEIGMVYDKDKNSVVGKDVVDIFTFSSDATINSNIKDKLNKWIEQQSSTPSNPDIYAKAQEIKKEIASDS